MKVILTMDVPDVGSRGDRIDVSAGYARNYLIPRRLAIPETPGNLRRIAEEGKLTDVRERKERQEAQKVADFLKEHELFAALKIGREGKAFGAITSKDIAVLLRQAGLEVDRRRIQLGAPIKRLGVFEVPLSIHSDVETLIKLYVDRDGGTKDGAVAEEAEHQEGIRLAEEAAKAEAEAREAREKEAEEAARIAIEKAAARQAREEEEAKAREEAEAAKRAAEGGTPVGGDEADGEETSEAEEPTEAAKAEESA